ncbi:MAG TPA: hypothetical protein VLW06_02145 [Terriglobales bacterium]|nr:hypothetical protein [Terriglobales bacterium]
MAVLGFQLNRFERMLFKIAVVLAAVLVVVRIAAIIVLSFLHHAR